jgi:hypothetical protein
MSKFMLLLKKMIFWVFPFLIENCNFELEADILGNNKLFPNLNLGLLYTFFHHNLLLKKKFLVYNSQSFRNNKWCKTICAKTSSNNEKRMLKDSWKYLILPGGKQDSYRVKKNSEINWDFCKSTKKGKFFFWNLCMI